MHSVSTGFSVKQTLGCGVAFLSVPFDGSFKLFRQLDIPVDETALMLLSETVKDTGTRSGVALFLLGWALEMVVIPDDVDFCPIQFCPVGSAVLAGDDMASNSLVKEMQGFAKSEFSVDKSPCLKLRLDVAESVNVLIASLMTDTLLQGVFMSVLATGVLN